MLKPIYNRSTRSLEVHDIVSAQPSWLLKWSITILTFIILMSFYASWLIQTQDTVTAPFTLTSVNPPKLIIAHKSGEVINLLVKEGSSVSKNQPIIFLESIGNHEQVITLGHILSKAKHLVDSNKLDELVQLPLENFHQLGELQPAYQPFILSFLELKNNIENSYYNKQKAIIKAEMLDIDQNSESLQKQQDIRKQSLELAQVEYKAQTELAKNNVIPKLELNKQEDIFLAKKLPYEQGNAALINNNTNKRLKAKEILELEGKFAEQKYSFRQALNTLENARQDWEHSFIIRSTSSGILHFTMLLHEHQQIKIDNEICYVYPKNTLYSGILKLEQKNVGKVKINQKIRIQLDGYPYQEYGMLSGNISYISYFPVDRTFFAEVKLPEQLITSRNMRLNYKIGMTGTGAVITRNQRLLERLLTSIPLFGDKNL